MNIYERPMACRLEGVPMVDTRHGLLGDWCDLNFTGGVPEDARAVTFIPLPSWNPTISVRFFCYSFKVYTCAKDLRDVRDER